MLNLIKRYISIKKINAPHISIIISDNSKIINKKSKFTMVKVLAAKLIYIFKMFYNLLLEFFHACRLELNF